MPRWGARTAALGLLAALLACGPPPLERVPAPADEPSTGRRGGRLVVALRAEPKTLNPVVLSNIPSTTVIRRMHGDLVHINRRSQQTEPGVAEGWTVSEDGRRYAVTLRPDLRFSDGRPAGVEDVLFTFRVLQDEAVGSPYRDLLRLDGRPIVARAIDERTVEFELSKPYAAGDRLFDTLAILPRHLLEESYRAGRLSEAWGLDVAPERIAGLGPFRLASYVAGERLVLERNPHYWKTDADGTRLPYLDEIVFLFVASEDAQVIRFQSGETDVIDRLSAENFAVLERGRSAGYRLYDLGPGLVFDFLFFNLNPLPPGELPRIVARQRWFRDLRFRQAVSAAVDREAIVRLVYQGRAAPIWSHVSPGNKLWFNAELERPPRSLERARARLAEAGFVWRGEELVDAEGTPVSFSITTSAGNSERVRMMTIVQEDLRQLGMEVQLAPLEFRALLDRVFNTREYEACILGLGGGDADPNPLLNVLLSSGGTHVWSPGQSEPQTPWEAEIDRLMIEQQTALDPVARKALYDRVQQLVAEHLPIVPLASPNVLVGAKAELGNFRPAVLDHNTLWNADELFWRRPPAAVE